MLLVTRTLLGAAGLTTRSNVRYWEQMLHQVLPAVLSFFLFSETFLSLQTILPFYFLLRPGSLQTFLLSLLFDLSSLYLSPYIPSFFRSFFLPFGLDLSSCYSHSL